MLFSICFQSTAYVILCQLVCDCQFDIFFSCGLTSRIRPFNQNFIKSCLFSVPGGFTDSKIIGNNKLFQSQLGRFLSPAVGQNSQWKLCYRASVYGFTLSSFHNYCDGKPDTVTIVKVGSYVFGGYTDIPWSESSFRISFSFPLYSQTTNCT